MPISDKLIDQLLDGNHSPEDLLGEDGLLKQLTRRIAERALDAEMDHHLGYSKHDPSGKNTGNSRNGKSRKTVRSLHGDMELDVPRDRQGEFVPQLVNRISSLPVPMDSRAFPRQSKRCIRKRRYSFALFIRYATLCAM